MHRSLSRTVAVITAVAIGALALVVAPASAGDGTDGVGLEGRELTFAFTSPDSDTACVSYYETTEKRGPAKHFDRVTNRLVELPFRATVGTATRAKHWTSASWATDDCASTADPHGTIRCAIKVDGKRKVRSRATDAIAFCHI